MLEEKNCIGWLVLHTAKIHFWVLTHIYTFRDLFDHGIWIKDDFSLESFFYYVKSRNTRRYPLANVRLFDIWYRFVFCYLHGANSVKTNLQTSWSISFKLVNQFLISWRNAFKMIILYVNGKNVDILNSNFNAGPDVSILIVPYWKSSCCILEVIYTFFFRVVSQVVCVK